MQTDASGNVVTRVTYRPYGEARADLGTLPPFAFNGQRYESSVQLYDYGARFYDPALGRFLSPDSVIPEPGDPQSLNRYSYVRNNPINRIDPTGNADTFGRNVRAFTEGFLGGALGSLAFIAFTIACPICAGVLTAGFLAYEELRLYSEGRPLGHAGWATTAGLSGSPAGRAQPWMQTRWSTQSKETALRWQPCEAGNPFCRSQLSKNSLAAAPRSVLLLEMLELEARISQCFGSS